MKKSQVTEHFNAPEPEVKEVVEPAVPQYVPRPKTIERQGGNTSPSSHRMPEIRGGTCEWCGVMDKNVPAQYQYQLCPHFRGMEMRCSYCDESINPEEVIRMGNVKVQVHPDNPDKLVVWCDRYTCSGKHLARFVMNR